MGVPFRSEVKAMTEGGTVIEMDLEGAADLQERFLKGVWRRVEEVANVN